VAFCTGREHPGGPREVTGFDVPGRRVLLADGAALAYDSLIVATGSSHSYFGHADWERFAPGLKTVEDATRHAPPHPRGLRGGGEGGDAGRSGRRG
jgi:hypothetical protein